MRITSLLITLACLLSPALLPGLLPGRPAQADEIDYVEAALAEAGPNRAELQQVLDHYKRADDPEKHAAARFLIANMPGKGYIVTELVDAKGERIPYDPLSFQTYKESRNAIEALEKQHGPLDFKRDHKLTDLETIQADFLIQHIDKAFAAWRATPKARRVTFEAFRDYILPYRGSQEPLGDWLGPLRERYLALLEELGPDVDVKTLYERLGKDVHQRVRFNERYYLHPTDQGFGEMLESGQGRCEDITNMTTFAARSMAIATAADYTPYWAHRDNNHAWNVLLDASGQGAVKAYAHAAKVYRKTYAIQRDALAFQLPAGQEAANRFMASTNAVDVTDQYTPVTDVPVKLDLRVVRETGEEEGFAYLCVFNGGVWKAIQWSRVSADGTARFERMGRNICYLPALFNGKRLVAAAVPRIVHKNGSIQVLAGTGGAASFFAVAEAPKKHSVDTGAVTPRSMLEQGQTYLLQRFEAHWMPNAAGVVQISGSVARHWVDGFQTVREFVAGEEAERFDGLPQDGLYWLIQKQSRRLERIFTIEHGAQGWW